MLHDKGRMNLLNDISSWRTSLFEDGLTEIPVDGEIGIRACGLANFHSDPADRIIVATALAGHRLLTSDEQILAWSGNLDRVDARE
jgi:PIN domain nuclease of toxin-antitoxin system